MYTIASVFSLKCYNYVIVINKFVSSTEIMVIGRLLSHVDMW